MAGGKIDILVEPDLKGFSGKMESGLSGAVGIAGKIGGAIGAALGGAATVKAIADIGVEFDKTMNTMSAVSQASAADLAKVEQHARDLGKSSDLTATSASDAAAAMTELVKGGFSVQEAMDAAKGTLQLASAAQINAADAATIQSQALQSFGLDASYAATASDVLAGAANASSAEIQGIAQGLQQSGAVANQFGLTFEDNATALAMFANAGIQGSDAGTLLKSALLAMTKDSKPARAAIEALGLTLWDTEGRFVGMESLFGQLAEASAVMTDETYASATAALFGSDAMRLAGVAAEQGAEGWTTTYEAVTRAGQASEVAAAQAQGMPGVLESIENQAEDTAIAVYDSFKGISLGIGTMLVGGIEAAAPVIELTATQLAGWIESLEPAVQLVGELGSGMSSLAGPAAGLAAALAINRFTGFSKAMDAGTGAMAGFGEQMRLQQSLAKSAGTEIGFVGSALATLETRSPGVAKLTGAIRDASGPAIQLGRSTKDTAKEVGGLDKVIGSAQGNLQIFGGVARGAAAGGLEVLKSGASGLIGFLGGPWGAAFTVAGLAVGHLMQRHQEAALAEAEHKASQDQLRGTLEQTTGAITAQTTELMRQRAEESGWLATATELGLAHSTVIEAMQGSEEAIHKVDAAVGAQSTRAVKATEYWEKYGDILVEYGVTAGDLAGRLHGSADATERVNTAMQEINKHDPTLLAGHAKEWAKVRDSVGETTEATWDLRDGLVGSAEELEEVQTEHARNQLLELERQAEQTTDVVEAIGDAQFKIKDSQTITLEPGAINDKTLEQLEEAHNITSEVMNGELILHFENGADVIGLLEEIGITLEQTEEGYIRVNAEEPEVARQILEDMGLKLREIEGEPGVLEIDSNADEVLQRLVDIGLAKEIDGKVSIDWESIATSDEKMKELQATVAAGAKGKAEMEDNSEETSRNIDKNLQGKTTKGTHEVWEVYYSSGRATSTSGTAVGQHYPNANGSLRAAANGLLSQQEAQIMPGGSWVLWAEDETEGESFIPHAPSKRARATQIMAATADIFGLGLVDRVGRPIQRDGTPIGQEAGVVKAFANGGIVESITGLVRKHFPMMSITSTYRNTNDHHGAGKAVDFSNGFDTTPEMQAAARFFYQNYKDELAELIHWPLNGWSNVKDGQHLNYGEPTNSQHRNHVHIAAHAPLGSPDAAAAAANARGVMDSTMAGDMAMRYGYQSQTVSERNVDWGDASDLNQRARRYLGVYDSGGWLPTGGMAVNLGPKPEPVFSPTQWALLSRVVDAVPALVRALSTGNTAGAQSIAAGMSSDVLGEVKVQAELADAAVLSFGQTLGGEVVSNMVIVQDAERGLIETRKGLAEESAALTAQEREVILAREHLTKVESEGGEVSKSTARKIEDAQRRLSEAQADGKADKVADAERALSRAREDAAEQMAKAEEDQAREVQQARETVDRAERDLAEMRELSETAAQRLEAAERTVIAARYEAIGQIFSSAGEALSTAATGFQELYSALADQARIMEQTRQRLRAEQIEQQTAELAQQRARLDMVIAEQDIARVRAHGAISVADAEAALAQAREQAALKGATGIDAMSRALDRARTTGKFAVEDVAQSVIDNAADVRAAQHAVDQARAQAALDELTATHMHRIAVLDLAQATLTQQQAVALVDISTRQLAAQAEQLGNLTAQGAQRAAGGWGGLAQAGGGLGQLLGGLAKGAAGFAVGGPLGALIGGGADVVGGLFDIFTGGRQAWDNRDEITESWNAMDTWDKVITGGGLLAGAGVAAGGAALSGMYGGEMASAAAALGAQIAQQSAGYAQSRLVSTLDRINSLADEERAALDYEVLLEQARIDRERWEAEMDYAARSTALSADVEIAELLGRIAQADTTEQADALAEAAIIAAERRDQMIDILSRQLEITENQGTRPAQTINVNLPDTPQLPMATVESLLDTIGRITSEVSITRNRVSGADYLAART